MELHFDRHNGEIDRLIDELMARVGVYHPEMIRQMILGALKSGQENDYLADQKLMRTTMKEMRFTNKVFAPYRNRRKVSIFGSARISPEDPLYRKCVEFSRLLVKRGYMVITGGGPGIMQAGNEGAGAENSFAINIELPFEQHTNPVMDGSDKAINYKYFFNRKVAFLKEADAVVLFPGGFGTLDEGMEIMTLIQTGKNPPIPLVMIDDDNGGYWDKFLDFIRDPLFKRGLISAEDFSLFTITRDPLEAVNLIDDFYRNYHSTRFVKGKLVIRLNRALDSEHLKVLRDEFSEIITPGGHLQLTSALPEEADQPDLSQLPRLTMEFNRRSYGLLQAFIRRINSFE
ncbi:TIGR00730 family Rossman fold protein [Geopsychrobacter electrodiphilus]|uniref:LOG family protein n=1 Tax=Geopsychrobacter electrodiphilus TaxID=225196 RepID=UPI00047790AA|nr:TIGR00730 family Rossman fold protein [Geopsychrobacter electrodiphilus]